MYRTISITLIIVLALAGWLIVESALTVRAYRAGQTQLFAQASDVLTKTEATLTNVNRVVLSIGGTAAEMRATAKEQRRLAQASHVEFTKLLTDARVVVTRTDANLNGVQVCDVDASAYDTFGVLVKKCEQKGGVLPQLTSTLSQLEGTLKGTQDAQGLLAIEGVGLLRQVGDDVHASTEQLNATLVKVGPILDGTSVVVNDPNIPKTIANVEGITRNVETATKPAKLWWKALGWAWEQIARAFTAFK